MVAKNRGQQSRAVSRSVRVQSRFIKPVQWDKRAAAANMSRRVILNYLIFYKVSVGRKLGLAQ
jgi:hypothetical protein